MSVEQLLTFIPAYVAVFFRVAAMMVFAPLFGSARVPQRLRVLLAAIISAGLASSVITRPVALPSSLWMLTAGIAGEIVFGLAMGMVLSFVFIAVQWAGEMIGQQMGLNMSEVFDPQFGSGGSLVGELYFMVTLVIFLAINGHHALLIGVKESLISLPLMSVGMSAGLLDVIVGLFQASTTLAFQLAAPMLVTMLVVDLALGFVSKTMPQLNIMTAGMGVRSMIGLIVLIFGIGMTSDVIRGRLITAMDTVVAGYKTGLAH
jgi:flagellar biosynthetic protein FliR